MTAQQMNVDNIAHNLSNSNTAGFKSRRPQFQDLMYQTMVQPGAAAGAQTTVPSGLQLGLGTRAASNEIIFTQGNFTQTSNPLDMVIQGNGFFQVRTPNGDLAYTRAGQFQLNRDGSLVDANGNLMEPQITLPQNAQAITIAPDGTVSYTVPGQTAAQTAGMDSLGQNLYKPTNASGDPVVGNPGGQEGLGTLLQGYTEQSNVSVVDEFVNLIVSQRAYEANSKVIKAADEMYQMMNNVTR
jgi:flagellar basal-body rod protein FlgG